jgi:hypothetical protein
MNEVRIQRLQVSDVNLKFNKPEVNVTIEKEKKF